MADRSGKRKIPILGNDLEVTVQEVRRKISSDEGRQAIRDAVKEANQLISEIDAAQYIDPVTLDKPYNLM